MAIAGPLRGRASRLVSVLAAVLLVKTVAFLAAPLRAMDLVSEPAGYKTDDYRSKVPDTLNGARVVAAEEAKALWEQRSAVFIDVYPRPPKPPNLPAGTVWRDPPHATIAGAHWLPNVGYGVLPAERADYLARALAELSGGDAARPLVFFCLRDCWMSWNAAKRAMALGYRSVVWFPDGTDAWQEIGLGLVEAKPRP